MTLTLELFLFFAFAVVAVLAAIMMLTARNAVHAALWLVTNFLCVAMFYLMLNAPFLAMIQVTVYAGAIMVLFVFVIMLLGAERLSVGGGRYGWITTATILLGTVLMVLAGLAITSGGVGSLTPTPRNPQLRVVHAAELPALDIYLNDTKALSTVAPEGSTAFATVPPGEYEIKLIPACQGDPCPNLTAENVTPVESIVVNLAPETATTYVVTGEGENVNLIAVPTDLSELVDKETGRPKDENLSRIQVVNATGSAASFIRIDPNERIIPVADRKPPEVLVADLVPGTGSPALELPEGTYELAWLRGGQRFAPLPEYRTENKTVDLLILTEGTTPAGQPATKVLRGERVRVREAFGSPQQMGLEMLSTYLLPFELVSLLLLAAMVGAIILTREEVTKRSRQRVKVSGTAAQLNRAMQQSGATGSSTGAESSAD